MTDPIWLTWWVWFAGAFVIGILELVLPGFIFLGFAIGAGITGVILLIPGLTPTLPVLLLIFAVLSLLAWLRLHRMFASPHGQTTTFDHDINDHDVPIDDQRTN